MTPEFFFNLAAFEHRQLYGKREPVWAALANLNAYLGSMLAQAGGAPYRSGSDLRTRFPLVQFERTDRVLVAPTAVIKPYTVIEGDVIIDEDAVVGPHAYLRGGVIVGRGARVGHCSEIKHSVLFPFSKAPHRNSILDSLLGWNVNVGGHIVTPNLRMDGRAVRVKMSDHRRMDTGLRKLGIIAGDGCFFGCAVRFNPGDYFLPGTRLT
ncbi:MAG TPA: hypothetical protein VL283_04910 [Candidatus Baltobacteraceae bacterium]|nr:hypothetical protein [Candidatus Baltobacteraceae bacterium]